MPKKQKAKIKQKNKCPEKLIRTEAAKRDCRDRPFASGSEVSAQMQSCNRSSYSKAEYDKCRSFAQETPCCDQPDQQRE